MRKKNYSSTEDDERLWETVTNQIKPLKSVRYSSAIDKTVAGRKPTLPRKIASSNAASATAKNLAPPAKAKLIDLRQGDHAGLDRTTRRKLERGNLPVEAKVDLHGYNAHQAETRLRTFIQQSASLGYRCVLVITGKGARGEGVLRCNVPTWLKNPPLRGIVLAISNSVVES